MPAVIPFIPLISAGIAGGASAGSSIYGAKKQSSAAKRASDIQAKADADALAYAKEQDALSRQDYQAHEARMLPFRQAGQGALVNLAQFAKVPVPPSAYAPIPTQPIAAIAPPRTPVRRTMPLSQMGGA